MMRTRIILAAMLLALIFLGASLWRIQVHDVSKYRSSVDRQSIRRVRLPGSRGMIYDRNGFCMADNRPSYCVGIYIEELRQAGSWSNTINKVEDTIGRLSGVLGMRSDVTREDIRRHINKRLPLPFMAWRDIDDAAVAKLEEIGEEFPGVSIYVEPVRCYPMGATAAHLLGYVGRANPEQDPEQPFHYYLPEMEGKAGIESALNDELTGIPGGYLIRVDASGFRRRYVGEKDVQSKDPVPGTDIVLTIDSRIQLMAEKALVSSNGPVRGAVVVLDPRNGDVLALASSPAFDPNSFTPSVPIAEWQRLNTDEDKPLINRAIAGIYPPGSTFKPLIVITALDSGCATADTTFNCCGYFDLGNARFHCWQKTGHGTIPMRKAIEQSCNAYFCQLGLRCGYERIRRMADMVGFGHKTGIILDGESAGLLPRKSRGWSGGDTCNISIGQGAISATPLQMAVFTASIANGGTIYRPRLVLRRGETEGEVVSKMGWSAETMRLVRGGMHDVVEAESGTGKRAKIQGVEMAGKTGTAEFETQSQKRKHTWMTVFAPCDKPRYTVAMVLDEGVSGGVSVAPQINKLMTGIFQLETAPTGVVTNGGGAG
jgi:penicillin-binding protein 2